jgi:hypothetical protein
MPQSQNIVPLLLRQDLQLLAIATGNNAAWLCPCGYQYPLIGRSGAVAGPTPATEVHCPICQRRYFVLPDGYDQAAVLRVEELAAERA